MESCLRIVLLLFLVTGTLSEDGFNLEDALGDLLPATEKPKAPEKPKLDDPGKPKKPVDDFGLDLEDALGPDKPEPEKPKKPTSGGGGGGFGLDLEDALGPDKPEPEKPKKPTSGGGGGGFDLDLEDALGPDPNPTHAPNKPAPKPKPGGGGGSFDDSDLADVGGGDYKPDGGRYKPDGGSGRDAQGGADQPQEAGTGQIAGIASAIGVAILGAASSYFAYQKKKLCFKLQGGVDPESGKGAHGTQSEPQVLSNLLRTA